MDVLLRLRVLIWVLVISLWGMMVYQYLGEEETEARMRPVVNPYQPPAPPPEDFVDVPPESPSPAPAPGEPPRESPPPIAPPTDVAVAPTPAPPPSAPLPKPPSEYIGAVSPAPAPGQPKRRPVAAPGAPPRRPKRRVVPEDRVEQRTETPVPPGFAQSVTPHFIVYAEQYPASDRFLELIESLHGNLMLDLAPFSPWASRERVTILLFKSQDTYRRVTGRPAWSGGASSVPKRKVYVYESEELPGILAHELTHIYFDGFFLGGTTDPLWLSEGMATLVQVERGLSAPNWLRENLLRLERGEGFPLEEMVEATGTAGWPDERVRLWYAQAYSVVRFMIRTQYRSSFYKFSSHLREGRPAAESLYRAYGAPYTRLKALELAWRYEMSRQGMAKLGGAP